MTPETDQIHLRNIAQSIMEIEQYVKGMEYNDFVANEDARMRVSRELQAMGDAAAMLTPEFRDTHGQIDFAVLETLKNTHYNMKMERDHHALWSIVTQDLSVIREEVLTLNTQIDDENQREQDIKGSL